MSYHVDMKCGACGGPLEDDRNAVCHRCAPESQWFAQAALAQEIAAQGAVMNEWSCDYQGCPAKCVGVGGAIGLRAIGWFFRPGAPGSAPRIYCPAHRPDGTPRRRPDLRCDKEGPCGQCAAELEADQLQTEIASISGERDTAEYLRRKLDEWSPA